LHALLSLQQERATLVGPRQHAVFRCFLQKKYSKSVRNGRRLMIIPRYPNLQIIS